PLIISGAQESASDKYRHLNEIMPGLRLDEHYMVDEKGWSVTLTDDGVELAQELIGIDNLYDPKNLETLHILNQLLRAHTLYKRDQHYMVSRDGKVMIIDEFTGRVLAGRRWSDGLHQAVEAKENVPIQEESRTMATITFQNLFRLYNKLAGMTGTAQTEAAEFHSTYELDAVAIPTNKPVIRQDDEDVVYKTEREKFTAVINEIMEYSEAGRPVLVGTTSVEKSAAISRILKKKKIAHSVLNAKQHENEAYIVAQAGRKGAITVSTNMAGRGTDILLGGNAEMIARLDFKESNRLPEAEPEEFAALVKKYEKQCKEEHDEVIAAGGLHIIGTERHESRRIDNQLRGRAGRQGDPGSSRFYLSLEDDLMRIFAGDRVKTLMDRMGMPDDEPIEHPWVTKSVENAQRKVEERNFDIRKNLLEYDDVMNAQRKTVYALRQSLLVGRYEPEEIDETGKVTDKARKIPTDEGIKEKVAPVIAQLVNMFAEEPLQTLDKNDVPRPPNRKELKKVKKLVEVESLQHEVYQMWGVKLELEGSAARKRTPLETYDELVDLVAMGLSEQRERFLDLIDRVVSAIVEESCPPNRQPEDWDWKSIHQGFNEHFKEPLEKDVDDMGELETLVCTIYERAEALYLQREEEIGVENMLRLLRHVYLEEIDRAWVDHLSNMEHLRDGIGLRGYGQRDPKNEYKKEGYNLFVNMMARVSSNVIARVFDAHIQRREQLEAMEAEAEARHQAELEAAVAKHLGEAPTDGSEGPVEQAPAPPPQASAPKIGRNDPCPCGSGKKFKKCHGAALEDDDEDDDANAA
ncbi:MAG: SEC-C domain-containing protein, partial [Myxococcales bacterium]|nr:SEC-C domain-containing protein [Myxococcales bacterium]